MKKSLFKMILFTCLFSPKIKGQNTLPTSGAVGIGTTSPNANLQIISNYGRLSNCGNYTGLPGLKISRNEIQWCNGTPTNTNTPPNILEIVKNDPFVTPSTVDGPLFIIDASGGTGIGTAPINNFRLSVAGDGFISRNFQVKNKFRINTSSTLTSTDWGNTAFPYTFSVDNGNSRFMGNVKVQNSNLEIQNGNFTAINGNITAINSTIRTQNAGGTSNFRVDGNGLLIARQVDVHLDPIPDYVFHAAFNTDSAAHYESNGFYKSITLQELDTFVQVNRHLPGIKSASEYQAQGSINLGELQLKLLQKVEELTLYNIELLKNLNALKKKQTELELSLLNLKK